MQRDRDETGRPRNARPRDEAGRPLPRGASGASCVDDDIVALPHDVLAAAQQALDDGRPFAAHELLESAWRRAADNERDFWQGLAQLAVGLTHLQRGNTVGAVSLLRRGAERLTPYAGGAPYDVNVDELRSTAVALATDIERGQPVDVDCLRLLRPD